MSTDKVRARGSLWLEILNRINAKGVLARRGIVGVVDAVCPVRLLSEESVEHLRLLIANFCCAAVGLCLCPCLTILFMLYQLFSDPFGLVFPSSCFNVFTCQKQNHLAVSFRTHYDELDFLRKICESFLIFTLKVLVYEREQ